MEDTALDYLQHTFGYSEFRLQQGEIIQTLIDGDDAVVLMPTGGGKSLCYQIPSLVRSGTGIIISPLIALMHDQVIALQQLGINKNLLSGKLKNLQIELNSLDADNVAPLFWAASNWAKWIDMHRDDPEAIAQLARATTLMQRVLDLDDTFYYGGAHMYFGVYYGSRAPMLGGNFDKSKQHFDRAREITDSKLLIPDLLQAQYLARQMQDRKDFHERLTAIVDAPDDLIPELGLQNQIAKRKAALLLKKEGEWF